MIIERWESLWAELIAEEAWFLYLTGVYLRVELSKGVIGLAVIGVCGSLWVDF